MTNIKTPELLPCPFCGAEAGASIDQFESAAGDGRMIWIVGCNNSECEVTFQGNARHIDAVKLWNTRANAESGRVIKSTHTVWVVQYSNYTPAEVEAIFATKSEAEKYRDSLDDSMWEVRPKTVFTSAEKALSTKGD